MALRSRMPRTGGPRSPFFGTQDPLVRGTVLLAMETVALGALEAIMALHAARKRSIVIMALVAHNLATMALAALHAARKWSIVIMALVAHNLATMALAALHAARKWSIVIMALVAHNLATMALAALHAGNWLVTQRWYLLPPQKTLFLAMASALITLATAVLISSPCKERALK